MGKPSPFPRPCPETTSPSRTNRRPSAMRGHSRSPAESASRIEDDETLAAVHVDELHTFRGEPERRPQLRQVVDRAGGAVPEREVPPHHRMHPVHAVHEDALDEPLRRDLRELLRERQHDQLVDARGLDQRRAPLDGRQQSGLAARRQHLTRMPVERHRDGADASLARRLHRAREHRPMAQMHAVEEPDGDHRRAFVQRESLDPFDDPHARQRIENLCAVLTGRRSTRGRPERYGGAVGRARARVTMVAAPVPAADAVRVRRRSGQRPGDQRARRRRHHGRLVQLPRERGPGRDLRADAGGAAASGCSASSTSVPASC